MIKFLYIVFYITFALMNISTFFNTVFLRGAKLTNSKKRAKRQNERVLQVFIDHFPGHLSAHQVMHKVQGEILITSIRRSITNLHQAGLLRRMDERRASESGGVEFCYKAKASFGLIRGNVC